MRRPSLAGLTATERRTGSQLGYRRRADKNHGDIAQAFRDSGVSVLDLRLVGGGCPDLLVADGMSALVEIKTEEGELNGRQLKFNEGWKGARFTVRDLQGVETVVKYIRSFK